MLIDPDLMSADMAFRMPWILPDLTLRLDADAPTGPWKTPSVFHRLHNTTTGSPLIRKQDSRILRPPEWPVFNRSSVAVFTVR